VGWNPALYWMNVNTSYYIFIEMKKNKGSQKGHTKKKIFKNEHNQLFKKKVDNISSKSKRAEKLKNGIFDFNTN
jgi:hypothetical protein